MTLHTALCSDEKCAACFGTEVGQAKFVCNACHRTLGYCMGSIYDMSVFCDDCAARTYNVDGAECTLVEFLDCNAELPPDELASVLALAVGQVVQLGGGAYAQFQVGRGPLR